MSYITKQKFDIKEILPNISRQKTVFLHEPEYFIRNLYERYLNSEGYLVESLNSLIDLGGRLAIVSPDLLIISSSNISPENFLNILQEIRKSHSHLAIVTIGHGLTNEVLSQIMGLGVMSHVDRKFSRPADLISIIKTII